MDSSAGSLIRSANQVLIVEGDLFTPGYPAHLTDSDMTGRHEAIGGFVTGLRRAFPDVTVEIEILVEAGDRIARLGRCGPPTSTRLEDSRPPVRGSCGATWSRAASRKV